MLCEQADESSYSQPGTFVLVEREKWVDLEVLEESMITSPLSVSNNSINMDLV